MDDLVPGASGSDDTMVSVAHGRSRRSIVVNIGNLLSALGLLFMVSGALVTSYIVLQNSVSAVRAELEIKLQDHSTRIAAIEKTMDADRAEQRTFQTEMRTALGRIEDTLTRIQVALGPPKR